MSESFKIDSRPSPSNFLLAEIMGDGDATVTTLVGTSVNTSAPLGQPELFGEDHAHRQLSAVGFLSGSPVSVERGLFRKRQPLSATVIAEEGPFWLGAMRVTDWSSIRMLGWKPSDDLDHPELALAMGRLRDKIEVVNDMDALTLNSCRSSLVLMSVSLAYIGRLLPWLVASTTGSALLFVEDVGRRPDLPVAVDLLWRKISHQRAGGVSTQVALFGFFRLGGWTLDNKVGRAIGHILDYSLRLAPVELKAVSDRHYTVSDRLRRKELSLPLLYATHWCASSYGRRSLRA